MPKKKIRYHLMSTQDGEREFYGVMGKFFASADIRRDLDGYPLNNDDSRMWIVAFDGEKPVGFGSFGVLKNNEGQLYDAWVAPEYRRQGIHKSLLAMRLDWFAEHGVVTVHVIAYPSTRERFLQMGFKIDRMRGKYAYMSGATGDVEE